MDAKPTSMIYIYCYCLYHSAHFNIYTSRPRKFSQHEEHFHQRLHRHRNFDVGGCRCQSQDRLYLQEKPDWREGLQFEVQPPGTIEPRALNEVLTFVLTYCRRSFATAVASRGNPSRNANASRQVLAPRSSTTRQKTTDAAHSFQRPFSCLATRDFLGRGSFLLWNSNRRVSFSRIIHSFYIARLCTTWLY